ncbi:MAG TPA: extracellular solute-binding protein [Clostridiales bacterium]|nr:extracellular solute-binding protein [Clostridiales bacterium]
MKRFRQFLCVFVSAIVLLSVLAGCGNAGTADNQGGGSSGDSSESASSSSVKTSTFGNTSGSNVTTFEMWTFVELHGQLYKEMAEEWNKANPNEQIAIALTVMPYDDMHNKLMLAIQSGTGMPDICDVEIGNFPKFLQGDIAFMDLTKYIDQYRSKIVPSRIEVYSKGGKNYGVPTHVGATVAFYNTDILKAAGVDYKTIKTWDDYEAAGLKVKAAGHIMGVAETNNSAIFDIMLAEQGADKTDSSGKPTLNTPEAKKALTLMKKFYDEGIDKTIPGGHPDTEEAYGALSKGEYATVIRPLWYMSRYLNYMDDLKGKIAIAPVPTFKDAKYNSFGGGGTGTIVSNSAKNKDLAARWLTWAKLSDDGEKQIWNILGFDPCNTALWNDPSITQDKNNKYLQFFQTNPFDVLNDIKDSMGIIKSTIGVPTVNNILCNTTLADVLKDDGADPSQALEDAQSQAENELANS